MTSSRSYFCHASVPDRDAKVKGQPTRNESYFRFSKRIYTELCYIFDPNTYALGPMHARTMSNTRPCTHQPLHARTSTHPPRPQHYTHAPRLQAHDLHTSMPCLHTHTYAPRPHTDMLSPHKHTTPIHTPTNTMHAHTHTCS